MELRFSRCSVALLLLLFLFVAANALRGPDVQVDEQKRPVPRSRGSSRFNSQSAKIVDTSYTSTSTSKPQSRRGSQNRKANGLNSHINEERTLKSTALKSTSTESKRNVNFETRKTLDKGRTTQSMIEEDRTTSRKHVINKKGADRRYLPESSNTRKGRKTEEVNIEAPVESQKDSLKSQKGSIRLSSRQVEKNSSTQVKNAPSRRLEKNGPSVFSGLGSSEISRSRTGRKIQTTYSRRELRSEVPSSKRFASRRSDENVNISSKDIDLKKDTLPSGSENINVGVLAVVEVTKRSVPTLATSEEPQRQTRADNESRRSSDRGIRSRGRTSSTESSRAEDSGNNSGRGNLRKGSTRSSEQPKVTEPPEVNRKSGVRFTKDEADTIKSRNSETKSRVGDGELRSRGRRPDVTNSSVNSQRKVSVEAARKSGNRGPDSRTKLPETRTQDSDSRKRSRVRSRVETTISRLEDSTTSVSDLVTVVPEVFGIVAATESNLEATTIDLLQFGTPSTTMTSRSATTVASVNRIMSTTTPRATRRESEGTTRTGERSGTPRRRASKEDFYNHGLGFRGRRPLINLTTPATITMTTVPAVITTTLGSQQRGYLGWTLNRRPYHAYSGAESSQVTTAEESTTTSGVMTKPAGRRGNKTFVKTSGDSGVVGKSESLESENYPADFKAKLAQLKNSANTSKAALPNPRSSVQGHRKSPSALSSARSKMKLENALKLVKPELLDEEVDSKTTPGSVNEKKNLGIEYDKKLENRLSEINSESSLGQESVVKSEWKPKSEVNLNNEERSSKSRAKQGRSFTPRSKTTEEDTENNILDSSTEVSRSAKSKVSFKPRYKSRVENGKTEIDNSIGRGKFGVSSGEKNIPDSISTATIKPKKTSPRRSVKNPEEEDLKFKPRKLVSRYRNATKKPVQSHLQNSVTSEKPKSKVEGLRRSKNFDAITLNPKVEEATIIPTTVSSFGGETKVVPVTMKNYLSVTKSVITKVSEEISIKRLKASAFNDLAKADEPGNSKKLNYKSKNWNEVSNGDDDSTTTKIVRPTSRYARKKTDISKTLSPVSKSLSSASTSLASVIQATIPASKGNHSDTKRREFRPRTATYRRHSEVPLGSVKSSTIQPNSIAITPKTTRSQAAISLNSPSPLLVTQEPTVNVKVSNNSNSSQQQSLGILNSSNGSSNIFSPTKSVLLTGGNVTLLEQIRSTVAPLLGSLGVRSPVFSGVFNNETNINTAVRITPNGSSPRFSARYKGAELFVRKPSIYQSTTPSITSSSMPFTPIENSGLPPPIEVSNNGEPKIVTFYQALESATITNEQLKTNLEQLGRVAQVDRPTDNDPNGTNSFNNETEIITVAVTTVSSSTDTAMTPSDITQSPEATPRLPNATQRPENTPTSEPPTSEAITISETSPPPTMVIPIMEISNQIQVSTSTISTTTMEDVTTVSSIPDILSNDIGEASSETPGVGTTTSDNLTTETGASSQASDSGLNGTSTTEPSSTTDIFIVTPVAMESSSQMSSSETTTSGEGTTQLLSTASSEIDTQTEMSSTSKPDSTSAESSLGSESETPTTQMISSTESLVTTTGMLTDSMAIEPRFSSYSAGSSMMPTTMSTTEETLSTMSSISEMPSTMSLGRETQSTTMSFTEEIPSTTVLSTVTPTTVSITEIPSTTMPSTTETPSTTRMPSTNVVPLTTIMPRSETSTIIPVTGYPRFPKLQSFLDVLAQLKNSTTKSQVIQVNTQMTTPFNQPTPTIASTTPVSTTLSSTEMPNTSSATLPTIAEQTTIMPSMPQNIVSNSSSNIEMSLEENVTTTEMDQTLEIDQSSTTLPTQPRIAMTKDEFMNMTRAWINGNDNDTDGVLPFNNDILMRLMNVASKLFSKPLNATQSLLLQKTLENTDRSSLDKLPSLLGGFLDHTDRNYTTESMPSVDSTTLIPHLETPISMSSRLVEQTTETLETTSASEPLSLTSDSQTNEAQQTTTALDLTTETIDTFNTNPPQTQTASILDLYAMLSDLVTKAPTTPPAPDIDSRIQDTTLTPSSTEQTQMVEETTPNMPLETTMGILTTMSPDLPDPTTLTPTLLTRFQDTTPATAQGTAGANMISTNLVDNPTTPSSTNPTTNSAPTTIVPTTTPSLPTTSTAPSTSSSPDATTITQTSEPMTTISNEIQSSTIASEEPTTPSTTTESTTTPSSTTPTSTTSSMSPQMMTTAYLGRFGGSRITPAPRFSSSSSTTAPLRDYLVYGIYPNKTIVRKRPEDNLIDARNIDSPYVIFGIYPDGRLVRKFPNGTVIPDPPSNPVEVVFSLSTTTTTTTNRPSPLVIVDNQANQGSNNKNAALSNNRSPVATLDSQNSIVGPNDVENGLSGNAIGPAEPASPVSPTVGSVGSTTQKMVIDAQNATSSVPSATSSSSSNSNVVEGSNGSQQGGRIIQDRERDEATRAREAGGQRSSVYIGQDKFINYWTNDQPNTNPQVLNVKINSVSTATSAGSASSATKLPSFNLQPNSGTGAQVTASPDFPWKDPLDQIFGITTNPPSISASVASNMLDDINSRNRPITARPLNPFVEIFAPISTGASSAISAATTTSTTSSTTSTTTTTTTSTPSTTTSTTTSSPPRITIPSGLFTTNMPKQNAFGTTFDDLAFLNTLLNNPRFGSTTPKILTEVEQLLANKILSLALGKAGPTRSPKAIQPSNASPNLLIETNPNSESGPVIIDLFPSSTTQKTPATWKPVTSTSSVVVNPWKTLLNSIAANQIQISTPNSVESTSQNLRPVFNHQSTTTSSTTTSTTTSKTTTKPETTTTTMTTTPKPPKTTTTTRTTTRRTTTIPSTTTTTTPSTISTSTTTTMRTTPKSSGSTRQVVITAKPRPRTTTAAPLGFGANLLKALFGGNLFGTSTTTPTPVKYRKPVTTTNRLATTTKPVSTTQRVETTERVISNIQVPSSTQGAIQVTSEVQVSKEKVNANLEATSSSSFGVNDQNSKLTQGQSSTFSPEDDAKFLMALLNAAQDLKPKTESSTSSSKTISKDDETFLRAILTGQANLPPAPAEGESGINNAALLAVLLKAEGIEPSTPHNQFREQLHLAGLEKNIESRSSTTSRSETSTTIIRTTTTRPRPAAPTWRPSSTYPPPLFGGFNFGGSSDSFRGEINPSTGGDTVRSQVVNAAIGMTRAFSQFLGGAIRGAAKQLQTFVGNGTRSFFS